jgi:pectin methylesterase-like acyl-CoA thioesterase
MNITTIIIAVISTLLASNGVGIFLIKRHYDNKDKTLKLCEVNNRQGEELVILSSMMSSVIKLNKSLVYALHEKGVFNGNTKEFNKELETIEDKLNSYTKSKKDKGLFV